jgi:hypothetical protein
VTLAVADPLLGVQVGLVGAIVAARLQALQGATALTLLMMIVVPALSTTLIVSVATGAGGVMVAPVAKVVQPYVVCHVPVQKPANTIPPTQVLPVLSHIDHVYGGVPPETVSVPLAFLQTDVDVQELTEIVVESLPQGSV